MEILNVDPNISDTASFMAETGAAPGECLNSIVVTTRRAGERIHTLILVPATHRLENKGLKSALGGKTSFMPMDEALALTGMERDSIGPVGVSGLPVAADLDVISGDRFFVGGGVRGRKCIISRAELEELVNVRVNGIYALLETA